ncbi:MAG: YodL domain-containing protein [Clostridiales bacterium]|nr:YodL domain-containing protein [Clostridiales bacterium]
MADTFDIYQIDENGAGRDLRFMGSRMLEHFGAEVKPENYKKIYTAPLTEGETLDSIYERFNLHHPADYRGHSLSVSDVIVLHQNGQDQAFFVDSFGFKQVPEFFADNPLKKVEELLEDDYGMIDGIINNGPRKEERSEKKGSLLEKLQEKKAEALQQGQTVPKPVKDKITDKELS